MKYVITFRYYETDTEKLIIDAKDINEVKEKYNKPAVLIFLLSGKSI